jgi:hypothetical protein
MTHSIHFAPENEEEDVYEMVPKYHIVEKQLNRWNAEYPNAISGLESRNSEIRFASLNTLTKYVPAIFLSDQQSFH